MMFAEFHWLRPWCLLALLPLLGLFWRVWRQPVKSVSWATVCDEHLLSYLLKPTGKSRRFGVLFSLFISGVFMIVGLAGPTWSKLPVPLYQAVQPLVVVLDMSESMTEKDLTPDRLARAKFKIHDLFSEAKAGQYGMVVYTSQPFVVSPLTEDANTIDSLLPSLTSDIMPVSGQKLSDALMQAGDLIKEAGFGHGKLLVLTATPPDANAKRVAAQLASEYIQTSVMPIVADTSLQPMFNPLALAGKGQLLPLTSTTKDVMTWLNKSQNQHELLHSEHRDIPLWRDEGRWFLWPALILLLPVFRRGWLRVAS